MLLLESMVQDSIRISRPGGGLNDLILLDSKSAFIYGSLVNQTTKMVCECIKEGNFYYS